MRMRLFAKDSLQLGSIAFFRAGRLRRSIKSAFFFWLQGGRQNRSCHLVT
jgi:hypothetical protein